MAYLAHVISEAGVTMDKQKVQSVLDWPMSRLLCAVRAFLDLVGYYCRFIHDYDIIVDPLTKLLHKYGFK
jgi:hypothetical protein